MTTPKLFTPLRLGAIEAPNRVFMAPLTRNRAAAEGDVPGPMAAEYYRQRASAGLIVSEASQISPQGKGYAWTPGIHSDAQVAGWERVTEAVHAAGGRIVLQLWHVGRISHASLQPDGAAPVSPSAVQANAKTFVETGFVETSAPRALEIGEIAGIVADYANAAANARAAGFDGVEVHGANGYLIDQFLRSGTNRRADRYGGSAENRVRFLTEVLEAVCAVWGADRVGLRLSPFSPANDAADADPMETFSTAIRAADRFGLAFLHVVEGRIGQSREAGPGEDMDALRALWSGVWTANNRYGREDAIEAVESGHADAIAFGVPFLANPDLPRRLLLGAPLNAPVRETFYGGGAEGYVDYPALAS